VSKEAAARKQKVARECVSFLLDQNCVRNSSTAGRGLATGERLVRDWQPVSASSRPGRYWDRRASRASAVIWGTHSSGPLPRGVLQFPHDRR